MKSLLHPLNNSNNQKRRCKERKENTKNLFIIVGATYSIEYSFWSNICLLQTDNSFPPEYSREACVEVARCGAPVVTTSNIVQWWPREEKWFSRGEVRERNY